MNLKEYVAQELNKPPSPYYDENGNSPRAVLSRGLWKQIVKEYQDFREYAEYFWYLLKKFNGLNTELIWFLAVPCFIVLVPILPLLEAVVLTGTAKKAFRREYEANK